MKKIILFGISIGVVWLLNRLSLLGFAVGFMVGAMVVYHLLHPKKEAITCQPNKNIHIFDDGKSVCHCWGMDLNGNRYSIPVKGQLLNPSLDREQKKK